MSMAVLTANIYDTTVAMQLLEYFGVETEEQLLKVKLAAGILAAGFLAIMAINVAFGKQAPGMAKALSMITGAIVALSMAVFVFNMTWQSMGWGTMAAIIAAGAMGGLFMSSIMQNMMAHQMYQI